LPTVPPSDDPYFTGSIQVETLLEAYSINQQPFNNGTVALVPAEAAAGPSVFGGDAVEDLQPASQSSGNVDNLSASEDDSLPSLEVASGVGLDETEEAPNKE
jgi:hypothetical protein